MSNIRKIFVTNALPYANGDIHLGHLLGYIQGDIWVRFQRMLGHTVHYICADDTHGTPVMLKAAELKITPEALIKKAHSAHLADFGDFYVDFDNYYTTHSEENRLFAEDIYLKLQAAGLIETREIKQFYDDEKKMFLPDRFIKGECPKCHAKEQYGDNCESCGAAYQPMDLIEPFSVISGKRPVVRPSEHFFFKLSDSKCVEFLRDFLKNSDRLQTEAANKMREWIGSEGESKLTDWDISRDAPYFGFPIPNAENKYFYVWLDAPIGYFASLEDLSKRDLSIDLASYIEREKAATEQTEMIHFIGKDILYFHTLFWPAMLEFSGYRIPTGYAVNGFLTVNSAKMSKSRGTFITARSYIDQALNPEWLRYYLAAKSSGAIEDIDLNLEDFVNRVNADLIGKYINIASRASGFLAKKFDNHLAKMAPEGALLIDELINSQTLIIKRYDERNFAAALREVARLCDVVNTHIDATKPWELAKKAVNDLRLHGLCTAYLEAFRLLTLYLKPILPQLSKNVEQFLNVAPLSFSDIDNTLQEGHEIKLYEHLMKRIELVQLESLVEVNKKNLEVKKDNATKTEPKNVPEIEGDFITIEDFAKLDLRLGKVLGCSFIEGSDKLLEFSVDIGEEKPRTIFSGIREFYSEPEKLTGQYVIVIANLKPRKMRFGISEGMILSASEENDAALKMLTIDGALKVGAKIS